MIISNHVVKKNDRFFICLFWFNVLKNLVNEIFPCKLPDFIEPVVWLKKYNCHNPFQQFALPAKGR